MNIQYTIIGVIGTLMLNLLVVSSAMAFKASVNSSYSYNNNVFRTKDNQESSNLMIVSPKISTQLKYKSYALAASYGLAHGRNIELPSEDYLNQTLGLIFMSNAQTKYSGTVGYSYKSSFDVRGETSGEKVSVPDIWVSNNVNSSLQYRTDDRRSTYRLSLIRTEKLYSVLESKIKDTTSLSLDVRSVVKLTGRSSVNYSLTGASNRFLSENAIQFDSLDMTYRLGFSWKYSGKLDTTANVGWKTRRIEASGNQVFSGAVIGISILWAMKSYSKTTLIINRDIRASPKISASNSIINSINLKWVHTFTKKTSTSLGLITTLTQANTGQTDTLITYNAAVNYRVSRRFILGPNIKWNTFKSTNSKQEYNNYLAAFQLTWAYSR